MLPAASAQAWWAGDSQQVSVTRGLSLPVALPGAATAPCPPLCPTAGGEGEPAPRTETHGDLHLPRHRLHPAAGSQHRPPGSLPQLSKPGRLPDTAVPTIQNGAAVADLSWDPFDPRRLAVGMSGEDAKIRLWRIPEGGLRETLQEPEAVLRGEGHVGRHTKHPTLGTSQPGGVRIPAQVGTAVHHSTLPGHTEKIYSIRFHPVASDLLVSSSYDMTVRIWDRHGDLHPTQEGPGPEGGRGARLVWVCGQDTGHQGTLCSSVPIVTSPQPQREEDPPVPGTGSA
uniref:Coronin n=1 Tax=Buteo japonicus TaxID=224669 RepID=A0A8C0HQN0_9AVES